MAPDGRAVPGCKDFLARRTHRPLAWMLLERNPERKLELACRGDELRRPETAGDVSDVVAELLRHRADKIAYGRWCHVQVIDLLHIHPVKQIEYLSANLSFNPLGERDHPLYPQAYVVVGVTQLGIARQVGHAVVEREPMPVQIPLRWSRVDGEMPGALQACQD